MLGRCTSRPASTTTWGQERDLNQAVGRGPRAPRARAPNDVVMALDTGAINYWTGHPAVVVAPNDSIGTVEEVAQAYDVRWLFVERSNSVPALGPIIDGTGPPGLGRAAGLERDRYRPRRSTRPSTRSASATADPRCTVLASAQPTEAGR